MNKFYYVYMIVSESDSNRYYVGITTDLDDRLKTHNRGHVPHTSKYIPWRYETVIAFSSEEKAIVFEQYLKTHSGRAFSLRHF